MDRRQFLLTGALLAQATAVAACSRKSETKSGAAWPTRPISFVMPSQAGGANDRLARAMLPYYSAELGVPVNLVYMPGAGGIAAYVNLMHQPADGYTWVMGTPVPFIAIQSLLGIAPYGINDFRYVNGQHTDYSLLVTSKRKPFKTAVELLEAIRSRPGAISAVYRAQSVDAFMTDMLLERSKLPATAVRRIGFEGGAEIEAAVLGGQVDFAFMPSASAEALVGEITVLASASDKRDDRFGAVPINEALKSMNVVLPIIPATIRSITVPAALESKYPDRWSRLVEMNRKILAREDVKRMLDKANLGSDFIGPEETLTRVRQFEAVIRPYIERGRKT